MENSSLSLSITKREKDYILFNLRGFFRHYKLEQNINKLSIDISNIQILEQEVNNLLSELNELNNIISYNTQSRKRLFVNRRNKPSTKSTDIVMKKINEKKQRSRMRELRYDLNKSNLTMRPKTPDVSKIFDKHKNKKINYTRNVKDNIIENTISYKKNYNKLNSKSFIQKKKYNNNKFNTINDNDNISHKNFNISNNNKTRITNNIIIKKNINENNSDINKGKMNYTMTKFPKEYKNTTKKMVKNTNSGRNKLNIISLRDISPNNIEKNRLTQNKSRNLQKSNIYDRYHSTDIVKKKNSDKKRISNKNNIISPKNVKDNSKKFLKINIINNKRSKMKTPSPKNFRKPSSPLLLDHDTIIKNKKRKINYNGHYHLPSFANKKSKHNKIQSEIIINKKDITKDEEKKLEEIITEFDNDINNNKNIMDLSQNILKNLEYIDNTNTIDNNIPIRDNLFMSNYIESLFLAIKLGYFKPEEKLKLLLISKELYFKFDIKEVINDFINYYEKEINRINNRINKYDMNIINRPFIPRKTGINSLNFITKTEEERLINESSHEYVKKIFEIILIFLNENNNIKENDTNIFQYLFNDIYKKNNVNNIKDLFIKIFVDKIPLIDDKRFNKINDILKEIPDLLSPSTLLAYNRNVSYLIFFLSELYNYFSFKTNDDVYYYQIRNDSLKLNEYINKINKLKTYL